MHQKQQQGYSKAFALPAVLIASVVMLSVLSVAVSSVAAVRTALKTQYYEQLAKTAGEAGVAYAKACLAKNDNVPLWTDAKPLQPHTDCAGNSILDPIVQVLVVGGGGAGGNHQGGGGGGGGVVYDAAVPVATGNVFSIVVGAGGTSPTTTGAAGNVGADSSFTRSGGISLIARGGGGGGGRTSGTVYTQPTTRSTGIGSGGGGAGVMVGSAGMPGGTANVAPDQGYPGGSGLAVSGSAGATIGGAGGGGGGAGVAGGNATPVPYSTAGFVSGAGGNGRASEISGSMVYYGAGGSGGRATAGSVGEAGITGGGMGGTANNVQGAAGVAGTGAGGGGGAVGARGGAGGRGVVIVRHFNNGGVASTHSGTGVTVNASGSYRTYIFTAASGSTFQVTSAGASSCPADERCSVLKTSELRSSFSVGRPTLDAQGKAVAIANTGFTELLRKSDQSAWRRYNQPSAQSAVVPDLCSGSATSALGWSRAVPAVVQDRMENARTATTITMPGVGASQLLEAGQMYFRRDFPVTTQGNYTVSALTTSSADRVELFVDGAAVSGAVSNGTLGTGSVSLSPGCHTITARLTNRTLEPRASKFTAAIHASTSATTPIVSTDSQWRASTGLPVGFTSPDFYADSSVWTAARQQGSAAPTQTGWPDSATRTINPNTVGCADCPDVSTGYLRDASNFTLAANTELVLSALCDTACAVYINNQEVASGVQWSSITTRNITLPAGTYRMGVIYTTTGNRITGGAALSLRERTTGTVLSRTTNAWQAANIWISGPGGMVNGYEASFRPTPNEIP